MGRRGEIHGGETLQQKANMACVEGCAGGPAEPTESSSPPLKPSHRAMSAEDLQLQQQEQQSRRRGSHGNDSDTSSHLEGSTWRCVTPLRPHGGLRENKEAQRC